jgi:hypothetical protein
MTTSTMPVIMKIDIQFRPTRIFRSGGALAIAVKAFVAGLQMCAAIRDSVALGSTNIKLCLQDVYRRPVTHDELLAIGFMFPL